jgi:hypothetical protein
LPKGRGNRLGRQVFDARDPKRRPFRNRGDMRDSRKEAAGEKETDGARDHSGSASIFEIILMKLTWLGHSAFRIEAGAAKILIDPFLSDNPSWDKGWSGYLAGKNSTQGGDR